MITVAERRERYVQAAVDRVTATASAAAEGERNSTLFSSACQLASLPDGVVNEGQILDLLKTAAGQAGVPSREALATIRSGIRRGRKSRKGWPEGLGEQDMQADGKSNGRQPTPQPSPPAARAVSPAPRSTVSTVPEPLRGTNWPDRNTPAPGQAWESTWRALKVAVQHPDQRRAGVEKNNLPLWTLASFREKTESEARAEWEQDRQFDPDARMGKWGPHFRSAGTLEAVHGLCLDLDNAADATPDTIQAALGRWAFLAHTTPSHLTKNEHNPAGEPRWRIILPYARTVTPAEAETLCKGWAPKFCATAFQPGQNKDARGVTKPPLDVLPPSQGMFMPAAGPTYAALVNDGAPLDPDAALAELATKEEEKETVLLRMQKDGSAKPSIENVSMILEQDPDCPYVWKNTFDLVTYQRRAGKPDAPVTDADYSELRLYMQNRWQCSPAEDNLQKWVEMVALRRSVNPLAVFLDGLKWDGKRRISYWLASAAGVDREEIEAHEKTPGTVPPLTMVYARKFLISMVARGLDPGCKVDTMLVLAGPQGIKKSTLFETLTSREYFVDSAIDPSLKDTYMLMQRAWVLEYSELAALTRADSESIKSFLTRPFDTFRTPYGRTAQKVNRHTIFVGTTNQRQILRDATGSRRFWCVRVDQPIDLDWVKERREQLLAEAVVAFRAGEEWWLTPEEERRRTASAQDFEEEDPWQELIRDHLCTRSRTTILKVLQHLQSEKVLKDFDRPSSLRVASIMRGLGWFDHHEKEDGKSIRAWYPGEGSVQTPGINSANPHLAVRVN